MTAVLTEGVAGSVDGEVPRERYTWADGSVLLPVVGEVVRVARYPHDWRSGRHRSTERAQPTWHVIDKNRIPPPLLPDLGTPGY